MKISKLYAARRQIHAAILQYFEDADAVSVHRLAGVAHILITELSDAANQCMTRTGG